MRNVLPTFLSQKCSTSPKVFILEVFLQADLLFGGNPFTGSSLA